MASTQDTQATDNKSDPETETTKPLSPKELKKKQKLEELKKRLTNRKRISAYSYITQWLLTWVTPMVSYCNAAKGFEFDMMNKLDLEHKYSNLANKTDYYFLKHKKKYFAAKPKKRNNRTFHVWFIMDLFRWDYLMQIFGEMALSAFRYMPSFMIQKIFEIQYFDISMNEKVKYFALYVVLMLISKLIYILCTNYLGILNIDLGLKTFYSTSHLVLKKTMFSSFVQNTKYNIGEIINLGTVDSQRFLALTFYFTWMVSAPFTIIFGIIYVWLLMGWTVIPALGAFFLLMIVNFYIVKMGLRFQKEFMRVRSLRIKLTNEVFENIRFVKTYSLEKFFIEKIVEIRAEELRWLAYIFYRIIYSIANSAFSPGIFLLVLFSVYVAVGNDLTSGKIFTVISIFNSFVISLTYLPNIFSGFIDLVISSERLTKFLMTPDQERRINRFDPAQVGVKERSEQGYLELYHERYVQERDQIEDKRENLEAYEDKDDGELIAPVEYEDMTEESAKLFANSYAIDPPGDLESSYSYREIETQNLEAGNSTPKGFAGDVLDVQIKGLHFFWKKFWLKDDEEEEKKKKEEEKKKKLEEEKKKKEKEEKSGADQNLAENEEESEKPENDAVDMEKKMDEKFRLKNIDLEIKKGEFVCIIGKSGSGKSSLFNAILGELFAIPTRDWASIREEALKNDVSMVDESTFVEEQDNETEHSEPQINFNPNLSYVSQKPWIRNATLKENILFGRKLNQEHYEKCVKYAGLLDDIKILKDGEDTIIGDKGINLSGGQKVRVALARALYAPTELFLFDDPLSALDVNVGNWVFRKAFKGYLQGTTRLVITHNLGYLKDFDRIVFMDKGKILFDGSYEEILDKEFYIELKNIMDKTKLVSEEKFINENEGEAPDRKVSLVEEIKETKEIENAENEKENVSENEDQENEKEGDKKEKKEIDVARVNIEEEKKEKDKYFQLGRYYKLFILVIVMMGWMVSFGYQYVFLNEQGDIPPDEFDKNYFYKMFGILMAIQVVTQFGRGFIAYNFALEVSGKLNSLVTNRLLHASINRFFNKNPIGKVLNRMSGDIERIDRYLPMTNSYIFLITSRVIVSLVLISVISNPLFLIFVFVYMFIALRMQRNYSLANIEATRLESITRSPFFQLFTDSVNGIKQIRAYRRKGMIYDNTVKSVELNFQCGRLQRFLKMWFSLRISLLSMIFVVPAFLYLILAKGYTTSNLGVVINFLLMVIDDISYFMSTISNLENNFVSFSRCEAYMRLEPEKGYQDFKHLEKFFLNCSKRRINYSDIEKGLAKLQEKETKEQQRRRRGSGLNEQLISDDSPAPLGLSLGDLSKQEKRGMHLKLTDVKVKYSPELPNVLRGISLEIKPGESIGIIGRTGAGKTSFVKLFIKFFDEYEGSILLNGKELRDLHLESLRGNITYISQESYFFQGTLRENLDPHKLHTDEYILSLLGEGGVRDKVELSGGLDWNLSSGGGDMSFGEKQIFCFIRAILNVKDLIIMDEATSNLDVQSEDVLEKLKDKYMSHSTVMIIAHRLNTIHSCDKVLILEKGKVQQFVNRENLSESELDYFKNYLKMFD